MHLTRPQFAKRVGVSARTIERAMNAGKIRPSHFTPGGHARFTEDQVEEWLNLGARPGPASMDAQEFVRRLVAKRKIVRRG